VSGRNDARDARCDKAQEPKALRSIYALIEAVDPPPGVVELDVACAVDVPQQEDLQALVVGGRLGGGRWLCDKDDEILRRRWVRHDVSKRLEGLR
jgi:hypothetical protein